MPKDTASELAGLFFTPTLNVKQGSREWSMALGCRNKTAGTQGCEFRFFHYLIATFLCLQQLFWWWQGSVGKASG